MRYLITESPQWCLKGLVLGLLHHAERLIRIHRRPLFRIWQACYIKRVLRTCRTPPWLATGVVLVFASTKFFPYYSLISRVVSLQWKGLPTKCVLPAHPKLDVRRKKNTWVRCVPVNCLLCDVRFPIDRGGSRKMLCCVRAYALGRKRRPPYSHSDPQIRLLGLRPDPSPRPGNRRNPAHAGSVARRTRCDHSPMNNATERELSLTFVDVNAVTACDFRSDALELTGLACWRAGHRSVHLALFWHADKISCTWDKGLLYLAFFHSEGIRLTEVYHVFNQISI